MKQKKSNNSSLVNNSPNSQNRKMITMSGILAAMFSLLFFSTYSFADKSVSIELGTVKNDSFIPCTWDNVPVYIKKNGSIWIDDHKVFDSTELRGELESEKQERKCKTFYLYADRNVNMGKVTTVLKQLKKAGFRNGQLVTRDNVTPLEYIAWSNDRARAKK